MYAVLNLIALLAGFLRFLITSVKTNPDPIAGIEQDGALVPNGALVGAMNALQTNASPAFGNWSQTLIPAIAAATYNGNNMVGGIIRRFSPGAAFTDCTDTATNIVNAIPGAKVNQTFPMLIANLGSGLMTLAAGAGVTIAGTASISSATARLYLGQVTGSGAVTMTNCFGWNLGTGGTLVAGL
jgi:hypothetical protein